MNRERHLVLRNLTKTFRDGRGNRVVAVNDISLTVYKGEFVTLIGPSGCGKTTTLRMVAGIEVPDSGEILLKDTPITEIPHRDRVMPLVFQSYALFPHMSVYDNIAYGLRLRNTPGDIIAHDVALACQMVNLAGLEHRYPGELSGGQQQRVALARALVLKPEIILFDEPLSNLDPRLRTQTRSAIRRIQHLLKITILYVTHDQSEALTLSDRLIVMQGGSIVQAGTPQTVYRDPATPFVADFIGEANFLDGVVSEITQDTVVITISALPVTLPRTLVYDTIAAGDRVLVAVHPDAIQISRTNTPAGFSGEIESVAFAGPYMEVTIAYEDGWVKATAPEMDEAGTPWLPGQAVYFSFTARRARVFGVEP
jgi:iron(III) transport system ATP-binding protein